MVCEFPVLETERLTLRNIRPTDLENVFRIFSLPENVRYYDEIRMRDITEARDLIARANNGFRNGRALCWGLAGKNDNMIIGVFYADRFDMRNGSCRISFIMDGRSRKKGLMSEAFEALSNYLYTERHMNRICCEISPADKKSEKLLLSYGFAKEGVAKSSVRTGEGEYRDSSVFAFTRK